MSDGNVLEAKKHALRQTQEGAWILTINVHPNDMPPWLLTAPMGQRLGVVVAPLTESAERAAQQVVPASYPAPEAASPAAGQPAGAAPAPKRKWGEMAIVTRAAMMCEDKRAWPIIAQITGWDVENPDEAAEALREYLQCRRREIHNYPLAVTKFEGIETEYLRATRP